MKKNVNHHQPQPIGLIQFDDIDVDDQQGDLNNNAQIQQGKGTCLGGVVTKENGNLKEQLNIKIDQIQQSLKPPPKVDQKMQSNLLLELEKDNEYENIFNQNNFLLSNNSHENRNYSRNQNEDYPLENPLEETKQNSQQQQIRNTFPIQYEYNSQMPQIFDLNQIIAMSQPNSVILLPQTVLKIKQLIIDKPVVLIGSTSSILIIEEHIKIDIDPLTYFDQPLVFQEINIKYMPIVNSELNGFVFHHHMNEDYKQEDLDYQPKDSNNNLILGDKKNQFNLLNDRMQLNQYQSCLFKFNQVCNFMMRDCFIKCFSQVSRDKIETNLVEKLNKKKQTNNLMENKHEQEIQQQQPNIKQQLHIDIQIQQQQQQQQQQQPSNNQLSNIKSNNQISIEKESSQEQQQFHMCLYIPPTIYNSQQQIQIQKYIQIKVTLMNCTITDFSTVLVGYSMQDLIINKCFFSDNDDCTLRLVNPDKVCISQNNFQRCLKSFISIVFTKDLNYNLDDREVMISHNFFDATVEHGVACFAMELVHFFCDFQCTKNIFKYCFQSAIRMRNMNSTMNRIENNRIKNCFYGIYAQMIIDLKYNSQLIIEKNQIFHSLQSGILVSDCCVKIDENDVRGSKSNGLEIVFEHKTMQQLDVFAHYPLRTIIYKSTFQQNMKSGIIISGILKGCVIIRDCIINNNFFGVLIQQQQQQYQLQLIEYQQQQQQQNNITQVYSRDKLKKCIVSFQECYIFENKMSGVQIMEIINLITIAGCQIIRNEENAIWLLKHANQKFLKLLDKPSQRKTNIQGFIGGDWGPLKQDYRQKEDDISNNKSSCIIYQQINYFLCPISFCCISVKNY